MTAKPFCKLGAALPVVPIELEADAPGNRVRYPIRMAQPNVPAMNNSEPGLRGQPARCYVSEPL